MHTPVLLKEVLKIFDPKPGQNYIDATIGGGGHAFAILEKLMPGGKVLGIDWDSRQIEKLEKELPPQFKDNLILVNDNYKNLENIIKQFNFYPVDGILFDLGFSSYHIEGSGKGFSFQKNEPLLMTYSDAAVLAAKDIVNTWKEEDIEKILREYGEEKFSKQIAKAIEEWRKKSPIKTTLDLVEIIRQAVPHWYLRRKIHPATKTFQALRIAVNNEFENIKTGLGAGAKVLASGGKLAAIAFHSGEDRIVKNFIKSKVSEGIFKAVNKKVIKPAFAEIRENPRARSAKLRVVVKM